MELNFNGHKSIPLNLRPDGKPHHKMNGPEWDGEIIAVIRLLEEEEL